MIFSQSMVLILIPTNGADYTRLQEKKCLELSDKNVSIFAKSIRREKVAKKPINKGKNGNLENAI